MKEAVEAPRIHWDGNIIQVEPGYGDNALDALHDLSDVNVWSKQNVYFGGVHAVVPDCDGAGDPRRGGDSRTVQG